MNKSDLIKALRKQTNLTKAQAEQVIELFFDEMSNALVAGDRVEIRGLFGFQVREYKGYTCRNPKTGKVVNVPPKKLPFFKCGKELKERLDYNQAK